MLRRDANCTDCKLHATAQYVCLLGEWRGQQDVMIVGEAPGKREDATGKAFVGASGKELEDVLNDHGFTRRNTFITNAVSCRPPGNRTPSKREIKACSKWLQYQIKQVRPKFVLLLGNVPLQSITGSPGIKKKRGRPFQKEGITYLATYHPSFALLRAPENRPIFERDIALFREIVDGGGIPREKELDYTIVTNLTQLDECLRDLKGHVSFDIETTCLYPWDPDAKINTIGFGTRTKQWIIPIYHPQSPWGYSVPQEIVAKISERLPHCTITAQNGKFDFLWMWVHFGVEWHHHFDFDTMLAHYILDENSLHDLKRLAQLYCGAPNWDIDKDAKTHGLLSDIALYQAHDLFYTRKLKLILTRKLREDLDVKRLFDNLIMPVARMFVEIEYDGVVIDRPKMAAVEKQLRADVAAAEKKMNKWARINWASTKQLADLLFNKLKIKPLDKTKGGANSTSESVLKRIDHPLVEDLLKFRGAKQQLSFFIEGWKPFLVKVGDNYFLHPSFKIHGTVTGRPSCEHPNLQQVPRDELIRSLIIALDDEDLVEADESQVELRIAAELASVKELLDAFKSGRDAHWKTAMRELERGGGGDHVETIRRTAKAHTGKSLQFGEAIKVVSDMGPALCEKAQKTWNETDPKKLWKEIRKKAKAVNFGYLYGMWWRKFIIYARDNYGVKVNEDEAQDSRSSFFGLYPELGDWHKKQERYVRRHGYVRSLSGRKRRLPQAMLAEDLPERREAIRQAINSPVQGFASDINLMSALQIREEFGRDKVKICGTVHDSILLRVKKKYTEKVTKRLLEIMTWPALFDTFDVMFDCPLEAEAKIGAWSQGISFKEWKNAQDIGHKETVRRIRRAA